MTQKHKSRSPLSLVRLLVLGWRKGHSIHDLPMWGLTQVTILVPLLMLVVGIAIHGESGLTVLGSAFFWLAPAVTLTLLGVRLHFLATQIGCTRQINISDDGNPTRCLIDLGNRECCKHIGPDSDKTACPYWKPELILE